MSHFYDFNLLPWRAEQRQRRYWLFIAMLASALILGIIVSTLWCGAVLHKISIGETALHNLQQQLLLLQQTEQQQKKVQQQISVIKKQENAAKQVMAATARDMELLQTLSKNISPFIYLNALKKNADLITITGKTISLKNFAVFMQKLAKIKWLEPPLVQEIRNGNINDLQDNFFTLQVKMKGNRS